MSKHLYLAIFILFINLAFGTATASLAQNSLPPTTADEFITINLENKIVCDKLPPGQRPLMDSDCEGDTEVEVSVSDLKNSRLNFDYVVSGGKIIGSGANIVWNLKGAQPGTYEIKVIARDKRGKLKQSASNIVTVVALSSCGLCECPTLSVEANQSKVIAGEQITFTANVSGGSSDTITYNWAISNGEIIEGQGTPVVKVATNRETSGKTVVATVKISGVCEECPKEAESTAVRVAAETDKN